MSGVSLMPSFDDMKARLQAQFSDGLVTIVGSGLSCAEGLPGMAELAEYLEAEIKTANLKPADATQWSALLPLIKSKGLEAALLQSAPSPSLEAEIISNSVSLFSVREKLVIQEVFQGKRTLRLTRLFDHVLRPNSGLPIITTNYDRLVEIAAEEAGLGVDTMFVGQFAGSLNELESRLSFCREVTLRQKQVAYRYRLRAIVFKPHGSLDWYQRNGSPVRYAGDLNSPRLVITPGLNKFRNGYESPFDIHREKANAAIDRASRFLIIGYGFNDDHLETHLAPRIRAGVPTLLLTHTLSPVAEKIARECANVIAIQRKLHGGAEGSTIIADKKDIEIPGLPIWDLQSFISEVLEP